MSSYRQNTYGPPYSPAYNGGRGSPAPGRSSPAPGPLDDYYDHTSDYHDTRSINSHTNLNPSAPTGHFEPGQVVPASTTGQIRNLTSNPYAPPQPQQYQRPASPSLMGYSSPLPNMMRNQPSNGLEPPPSRGYQPPPSPSLLGYSTSLPQMMRPQQPQYAPQQSQYAPQHQYPPQQGNGRLHAVVSAYTNMRRGFLDSREVRQVPLVNGNLVLDVPVPRSVRPLKPGSSNEDEKEMKQMRYTAATCDPDDFMRERFTLRQYLYQPARQTEIFIVMTMYNEDDILLLRTLNSVIKNIQHLCSRDKSETWGSGAWKKVVVCIVADGRKPCHPRVLKVLQVMGVYAEGVAKDTVPNPNRKGNEDKYKDVHAHIYEYTTDIVIIFCLKETNKKKLNSHRWFFNAFGPLIKPNVCILLDVGTKPSGTSIYELYKVFQKHENVGGACGEIYADKGKWGRGLFNPLVAGQNFEYKMSNILDKPFESVFGFISVLPGAFSAYRYAAVANHPDGTGPLAEYFHGELMNLPGAEPAGMMERNKFLAEDRILAYAEIVTKKNARWRLQYVKAAKAGTDVPTRVPEFISQRRRWLNGSIFASIHAIVRFYRIWTSGHGFIRKIFLQILTLYNLVNLLFNVLALSSYYLSFFFLISGSVEGSKDPFGGAGDEIFAVFNHLYIAVIVVILVCSLGNRPQGSNIAYTTCMLLFACCQLILLWCAAYTIYEAVPHTVEGWKDVSGLMSNRTFIDLGLSLMATYGLYTISSLMYLDPWHMLTSFFQYLLLLPSYVNILLIYAFSNLHDVSWGTKGDNGAVKDLGAAKVKSQDGKDVVQVAVPTDLAALEDLWREAQVELRIPAEVVKEKRDAETKRSDSDRNFRTNVLMLFLGTNMALIYVFTAPFFTTWVEKNFGSEGGIFNPYLTFIFYAVLGLSAMRFIGCTLYLLFNLFGF